MKDFPVFTTEFGVASLLLKEVPYREEAYIVIQSTCQPEELLKECVSFCRMVGAGKIYARGHEIVENYPLHCAVLEMRGMAEPDPEKTASLFPVTERTVGEWRKLITRPLWNPGTKRKFWSPPAPALSTTAETFWGSAGWRTEPFRQLPP